MNWLKNYKRNFIVLVATMFCTFQLCAQNILEAEELGQMKTFVNLQEALSQPDSVFKLNLKGKKLKEFPDEIFSLHNLQVLNLSKNHIKEIPADIEKLKSLQELDLSNNDLTQLPPQIGGLIHLSKLKLNKNEITSLPREIGGLIHLEVLEMWNNELDTIPDEVRDLVRLKVFELRGILFSDEKQKYIRSLLPETKIYFSPSCACKQ
ncbi:MAG TPA: leucine-rich repeat domain-containing protein [Bacteroidia bacterium]|nr:leucine-rich repeat domain-containing protein [Bacteroidia bacterium]